MVHMNLGLGTNSGGVWLYYFQRVIFVHYVPIIACFCNLNLVEAHWWAIKEKRAPLVNLIRQIEVGCQKVLVVK